MRKSILSASIAAMIGGLGFAGVAHALVAAPAAGNSTATELTVDNTGVGHILVVPYFTTQGTNATLLNIVNTDTSNGKVLKVRFRGASNSDDIFDFQLFLSPGDAWAAKISQGSDKVSRLETSDKSCTLPSIVATQANSFPTGRLNPSLTADQKAEQTREGYIEILNVADIPKAATADQVSATATATTNPLYTATKHVSGVAPCTAASLAVLGTDPSAYTATAATAAGWAASAQGKGLAYPSGLLFANYTIIDTTKTATFSGEAVAVRATNIAGSTAANKNANGNLVFFPQSDTLVPASAVIDNLTADPLMRTGLIWKSLSTSGALTGYNATAAQTPLITASYYDLPDLSTPYLGATTSPILQAKSLTTTLATKSVVNEYLTTTSIGATTDWVFSAPTRRYNVAFNYGYTSPIGGDGRVYTDWLDGAALSTNMTSTTDAANFFNAANTSVSNSKICVAADTGTAGVNQWDREETTTSSAFVISPGTVTNVTFCGETSVLAINNGTNTTSGSLSSTLALQNLNVNANEGWISLGTSGLNSKGLPVLGAAYAKSSAFGAVWNHRYSR